MFMLMQVPVTVSNKNVLFVFCLCRSEPCVNRSSTPLVDISDNSQPLTANIIRSCLLEHDRKYGTRVCLFIRVCVRV